MTFCSYESNDTKQGAGRPARPTGWPVRRRRPVGVCAVHSCTRALADRQSQGAARSPQPAAAWKVEIERAARLTRDATPDLMPVHIAATTQTRRLSSFNTRKRDVGSRHSLSTSFSATRASMACSTARVESSISLPLCSRLPFSIPPGAVCPATGAVQGRRLILAPPAGMAQQGRDRETRLSPARCRCVAVAVAVAHFCDRLPEGRLEGRAAKRRKKGYGYTQEIILAT